MSADCRNYDQPTAIASKTAMITKMNRFSNGARRRVGLVIAP
jgi:hypothetical protein